MSARRAAAGAVRILSWNVNGIRACERKGFRRWLTRQRAAIVGIQEVRAPLAKVPAPLRRPRAWHARYTEAARPGYSGVGLLAREAPERLETSLGEARFDREARLQLARFGRLWLANVYVPKGSGTARDNSRVPFKLDFQRALFERLERLRKSGRPVLVMGDFNTAHREIDLANPRSNVRNSGFLPEEREELDRWLRAGWVDTFRAFHPEAPGHYTWWSNLPGCRARNVGWRIDYVLASPAAMRHVRRAFHQPRVRGSDHCPVGVEVDPAIFG